MALNAIINRKKTPWWQQLWQTPYPTLAKTLYAYRHSLALSQIFRRRVGSAGHITVVCISDTHNSQPKLPPGDILVHAGDLTQGGTVEELQTQLTWLDSQPHVHKFVIAGNHDIVLDAAKSAELGFSSNSRDSILWGSVKYLEHSTCKLDIRGRTLSLYGHPSTPKHGNWAFRYEKGIDVFSNRIPSGVDILITHSPPRYHLDMAGWGDELLLEEIWRVKPKVHVFGHVHEGYGRDVLVYDDFERIYEQICSGRAGVLALVWMVVLLLRTMVLGIDREAKKTVLINASAVGGLRDQSIRTVQTVRL